MRVLVAGASGAIGRALVLRLAARGHVVGVFSAIPPESRRSRLLAPTRSWPTRSIPPLLRPSSSVSGRRR
jgi:nucleoside-diphosphate-sugar epimerase